VNPWFTVILEKLSGIVKHNPDWRF